MKLVIRQLFETTSDFLHVASIGVTTFRTLSFKLSRFAMEKKFAKHVRGSIELEKNDETGIARLTLNHPERSNALSGSMMFDLLRAIEDLECWKKGKGVILNSIGFDFSSGADLQMASLLTTAQDGEDMCEFMHGVTLRFWRLPLITVAAVNGRAIGGGAELTTMCDFRVMAPEASIHFVHARMGLVDGWGGGTRLVTILGPNLALEYLLGKKITDLEAVKIGYANFVSSSKDCLLKETEEFLSNKLTGAPQVTQSIKRLVIVAREKSVEESLRNECKLFGSLWTGPAHLDAMAAKIKHK